MTAPTIAEARAAQRINGTMATVLGQQLEEARLVERATRRGRHLRPFGPGRRSPRSSPCAPGSLPS